MKKYCVIGAVALLLALSFILFAAYSGNHPDTDTAGVILPEKDSSDHDEQPRRESADCLESDDVENITRRIDSRVKKINDRLNGEYDRDHYDGDVLMFRHVERGTEGESFTNYDLYYDKQGNLIYADITHYRDAMYEIYFHNNELLYVEVGPIRGGMENVAAVMKKDPAYAFVQEDIGVCLEHKNV